MDNKEYTIAGRASDSISLAKEAVARARLELFDVYTSTLRDQYLAMDPEKRTGLLGGLETLVSLIVEEEDFFVSGSARVLNRRTIGNFSEYVGSIVGSEKKEEVVKILDHCNREQVDRILSRVVQKDVANELGIHHSSLRAWISKLRSGSVGKTSSAGVITVAGWLLDNGYEV